MSKKKIWVLVPLGLLLLSLVVLAGCRPSTALTRIMNAMNALNPGTEETMTEEEQEEQESSDQVDPMDEEEEDARIEELDQLIGQLLENMDQEEAEEAVKALYAAAAQAHEWGSQEYNPENLDTSTDSGALALNIWDDVIRSESNLSNGYVSSVLRGTGIVSTEGVVSSSGGTASGGVSIRPGGGEGDGSGSGGGDNSSSYKQGVDRDKPATNDNDVPADTNTPVTDGNNQNDGGGSVNLDPPGGNDTNNNNDDDDDNDDDDNNGPDPNNPYGDDESLKSDKSGGTYGHKIAAAGDAAIMVCMLGGSDRLVATSPDFNNDPYIQQGFNSDGHMNYDVLWTDSGDGSTEMSETEFMYLMTQVRPDVCIEVSGSGSFSETQLDRMINWYGISYYAVAAPNTGEDVIQGVSNLAKTMDKSESEKTAQTIAEEYSSFYYDTILGHVSGTTPQRTVFIEDWDSSAQVVFNVKEQTGIYWDDWVNSGETVPVTSGCAVIRIGWGFRPLREFLVDADVYDWAVSPKTVYSTFEFNEGYGKSFNGVQEEVDYYWRNGEDTTKTGDLCYVAPVYDKLNGMMYYNAYRGESNIPYNPDITTEGWSGLAVIGGRDGISEIDNGNDLRRHPYSHNACLSFGYIHPGYSSDACRWDYVIAKNQTVAQEIRSNSAWQIKSNAGEDYIETQTYGYLAPLLNVDVYGTRVETADVGNLYDIYYYTTVEGNYTVLTNPTGLFCDWVDGSPESILETAWAACEIQHCQGYDEDALRQDIHDFYLKFYGLDIGKYSTEMNTILAGPVS